MEHVLSCVTLGVPSTENVKGGLSHGELEATGSLGVTLESVVKPECCGLSLGTNYHHFLCICSRVKALEHGKFLEVLWGRAGRVELECPKPS